MKARIFAVLAVLLLAMPVFADHHGGSVSQIIQESEDHTVLYAALEATGLYETLIEGEYTVFAPTDAAFEAAFEALGITAEDLLAAPELATTLLTYHVVEGTVLSTDLESAMVPSVEGSALTVSVSDMGVMVDQANVVVADLTADKGGVVHVIDSVLLTLPNNPAAAEGDINAAGSSTVFPLAERMKDVYETAGYASTLSIDSIGSGGGFARFCEEGASDIANASRAIRDGEVESCQAIDRDPIEIRVGTDALAVVVSADNDFVENLTVEELAIVFGSAELWSDVNPDFPAEPIERYIPDDASGTFDYFVEEVFEEDPEPIRSVNPTQSSDDNVLVEGIQGSEYAIGFFGYAYFAENSDILTALSIDGVEPSGENVDNGSYPLARPLFMYTTASIMAEKPQVADFLNFVVSDVNEYVVEVGYFPAAPDALFGAKAALLAAQLGGGM
jgi:phosphate transport system substrate-binding protein